MDDNKQSINSEMGQHLKRLSALINVIVYVEGLTGFDGEIVSAYLGLIKEELDKVMSSYKEIS